MGRAGGSGGHRSGGGMHSSGGHRSGGSSFSSGGGRSRSSSSGMSSRPSGGFGRPRSSFNSSSRSGFGHHSPPPPRPYGGFRHSAPPPPSSSGFGYSTGHRSGIGCSSILAIPITIMGIIILCLTVGTSCSSCAFSSHPDNSISAPFVPGANNQDISQVSYATSRGTYFEDNLEMSLSSSIFDNNMQRFKDQTGINPFVYTCSRVNGSTSPSDGDLDAVYNKLGLKDSVLLIYQEYNDTYGVWVYI